MTHFATVPVGEGDNKRLTPDTTPPAQFVLVVDDEPIVADTLAHILRMGGYAVATAYDAETALRFAELVPPEILVSDVYMPGMDGFELASSVSRSVPDCEVLLVSAHDQTRRIAEAQCSGYRMRFLQKPFHPDRLLDELSMARAAAQDSMPDRADSRNIHLVL